MWMAKNVLNESNEIIILHYIPLFSTGTSHFKFTQLTQKAGCKRMCTSLVTAMRTYTVGTKRRKGALLWKTTHQGIVGRWRSTSPIWRSTGMVNEKCLDIWIWPWTLAELVLPVETTWQSNIMYIVRCCWQSDSWFMILFTISQIPLVTQALRTVICAQNLTHIHRHLRIHSYHWSKLLMIPLIYECAQPRCFQWWERQFVSEEGICFYQLLQF